MPHILANINIFFIIFKTNLQKHILPGLPVICPHTMSCTVSIIMELPPPLVGGIKTNLRKRVLPTTHKALDCWNCLHYYGAPPTIAMVGGIKTNLRKRVLPGFPATHKELDCWSCLHTQKSYFDTHKEFGLPPYTKKVILKELGLTPYTL